MWAASCPDACGSELPTAAVPRAETPGRVLGYEARPGGFGFARLQVLRASYLGFRSMTYVIPGF